MNPPVKQDVQQAAQDLKHALELQLYRMHIQNAYSNYIVSMVDDLAVQLHAGVQNRFPFEKINESLIPVKAMLPTLVSLAQRTDILSKDELQYHCNVIVNTIAGNFSLQYTKLTRNRDGKYGHDQCYPTANTTLSSAKRSYDISQRQIQLSTAYDNAYVTDLN